MPPVINCPSLPAMGSIDDPLMRANDLPFGDNDNTVRVNTQADGSIGEGGRHTVAVALKVNQTGRRNTLAVFDEAVKGTGQWHEARRFAFPNTGDCSRLASMRDLAP